MASSTFRTPSRTGNRLLLLLLALLPQLASAGVSNVRLHEEGSRVVITYDLEASGPSAVRLIGSEDGGRAFGLRVSAVAGDIGDEVLPGKDRKMVWESSRDYPHGLAEKDVVLEVVLRPSARGGPRYFVIPVRGEVGWEVAAKVLRRALNAAESERPEAVVLEVDSPGGALSELAAITDLLIAWQARNPKVRLVAFIQDRALSAAAILSLACVDIVMAPGSTMGAAMAITVNAGKVTGVDEKFSSAYRAKARATAEAGGHEPLIAEAMIDPGVELWLGGDGSGPRVTRTRPSGGAQEPRLLDAADKLLTLTPAEALAAGVIRGVAADYAEAGVAVGLPGWVEVGDAGRKIVGAHAAEAGKIMADYEELVQEVRDGIDRLRNATSTRSAASSNVWSIRKAVDEIGDLAGEYPSIGFRVGMQFPGGVEKLRSECDAMLEKLRGR